MRPGKRSSAESTVYALGYIPNFETVGWFWNDGAGMRYEKNPWARGSVKTSLKTLARRTDFRVDDPAFIDHLRFARLGWRFVIEPQTSEA